MIDDHREFVRDAKVLLWNLCFFYVAGRRISLCSAQHTAAVVAVHTKNKSSMDYKCALTRCMHVGEVETRAR